MASAVVMPRADDTSTGDRAVVQVRLTARDKQRVKAIAASQRVMVSEFVRRLIRAELDAKPRDH